MTATKYLARALTVTLAAGALVTSAASCGAMNESRKDKEATSSSSAATPSTPAESASDSEADGSHGATEPDDKQSPTSSNGSDAGSPQGIPESAHAKLDPTPLTAEELKKGQQLPQDLVLKLFEGEYEQACGMLVFAKNGDLLRADVPELKSLCAQELEENIQKGEISSMPKEKIMEDSDPKHFTLHDNGDGTATFERDGEVSGEKLVRLDDGSLRILIEGF
ncbi:Uncharacterised protein [Mycobacteroides abscessus subsp. abscessus]|nr:Uncharacterised protein [Mycobacteroides abscessus subsp. abscessus]